jgi:Tfp pilus assembly protein PilZ
MREARDRDALFVALLQGASLLLEGVRLLAVQRGAVRSFLALSEDGAPDARWIRKRSVPLSAPSAVCDAARDGRPFVGQVPADDPCADLLDGPPDAGRVVMPVTVDSRVICLLVGIPRRAWSDLLSAVNLVVNAASVRLRRLMLSGRAACRVLLLERRKRSVHTVPEDEQEELERVLSEPREIPSPPVRPAPPPDAPNHALEDTSTWYPFRVEVGPESEHTFFVGFSDSVARDGGIFVATQFPAPIGQACRLTFTVPGAADCVADCRVRWIRELDPERPENPPGMGLGFCSDLPAAVVAAIERFTARRQPIFFD